MDSNLTTAITKVMKQVTYIEKTGYNAHHGYKYASDADLKREYQAAMADAGLSASPIAIKEMPDGKDNRVRILVTYRLQHLSGEHVDVQVLGEGMDSGDKAYYKALTGAQKYFYHMTFHSPTGDDPEGQGSRWTDEDQYRFWTQLHDAGVTWETYQSVTADNPSWPRAWELTPDRRTGLISKLVEINDEKRDGKTDGN